MGKHEIVEALSARTYLTFGGNETYLVFLQGVALREFAAFELVDDEPGWQELELRLLRPILDAAATHGHGVITDCLVWRASTDYVNRLGHTEGVAAVNQRAVARTRRTIAAWQLAGEAARSTPIVLAADVGPRGDGYASTGAAGSPDAARDYHAPQIEALAAAGIELVVALTMTNVAESIGLVRAADRAGLPIVVSPTVETDGRLPDGTPLRDLIAAVDDATAGAPVAYMANCAHPAHLEPTLREAADRGEPWLERFRGLRANASTRTHAELDESTELDRGDVADLARRMGALKQAFGWSIVGGCCGTDAEHLAAIAHACA